MSNIKYSEMCNKPQNSVHLKPLGMYFIEFIWKANKQCFNSVSTKRLIDPFITYYITLEPIFVNNICISKCRYQIGIGHFLPKKYQYWIGCYKVVLVHHYLEI